MDQSHQVAVQGSPQPPRPSCSQQSQQPAPNAVPSTSEQQVEQPFVNTGYNTWLERRAQWLSQASSSSVKQRRQQRNRLHLTYDMVLSMNPFPKPVPLEDVVEALVDLWEQEDMYD
mmetsp:Transcript_15888/g.34293  ORF Transcript_15888/g.34293 Transcript_15888/m.34293 type:complete len:116 (-) Transcript_15888:975-1322(-)